MASDALEIDYRGDHELHAAVCRPPSGKLHLHLFDEPTEIHGTETEPVDIDETLFISEGMINDVDG